MGVSTNDNGTDGRKPRVFTMDAQTGKRYVLQRETSWDSIIATLTFVYLVLVQIFFFWLVLDFWTERYTILRPFYATEPSHTIAAVQEISKTLQASPVLSSTLQATGGVSPTLGLRETLSDTLKAVQDLSGKLEADKDLPQNMKTILADATFRLIFFTFVGGALGAIVNSLRSLYNWHCDKRAFGKRHVWKYITSPLVGATLAVFVFAILSGGLAVLGGSTPDTQKTITMFAVGVLAGYSAINVFTWMDSIANRLFDTKSIEVPDVVGQKADDARKVLETAGLVIEPEDRALDDPGKAGTILEQLPKAHDKVSAQAAVYVWVARLPPREVPDVAGQMKVDAIKKLEDAQLVAALGEERETDQVAQVGTVLEQDPKAGEQIARGATVTITVGKAALVEVPDVVGQMKADAVKTLEDAQLVAALGEERETDQAAQIGAVLEQDPKAGETVDRGASVKIVVGKATQ
jgi:beta-lactam-binding protein with PASTA domain